MAPNPPWCRACAPRSRETLRDRGCGSPQSTLRKYLCMGHCDGNLPHSAEPGGKNSDVGGDALTRRSTTRLGRMALRVWVAPSFPSPPLRSPVSLPAGGPLTFTPPRLSAPPPISSVGVAAMTAFPGRSWAAALEGCCHWKRWRGAGMVPAINFASADSSSRLRIPATRPHTPRSRR